MTQMCDVNIFFLYIVIAPVIDSLHSLRETRQKKNENPDWLNNSGLGVQKSSREATDVQEHEKDRMYTVIALLCRCI
jgi:hypothetical protein